MAVAGQILVVLGALVFLVAAIGLLDLPDVYSRASAVTLGAELGTATILAGALLTVPSIPSLLKAVLALVLQAIGCAVGGMMVVRGAYLTGTPLWEQTRRDELAADGAGSAGTTTDGTTDGTAGVGSTAGTGTTVTTTGTGAAAERES